MPAMPIRLVAMSVDRTLLNSKGAIPQGVIQAVRNAERNGCVIVLATARPPRGLTPILQTLDITGPTINYNGAVIWNPVDQRPQYHEPLSPEVARAIVDEARQIDPTIMIGLDVLDRWYVEPIDPRSDLRIAPLAPRLFEPDAIGPVDAYLASPVTKLNLLGSPNQLQPIARVLREKYWRNRMIALFLTDPHVIQVTHPLVDKGIALQRIANRMDLKREEVMAIGDGSNDLGMLEWAGFAVAMGNAVAAARELADAVVSSNDDLGVARAIQRFVLARR
jgi:Cof subfamily protein (haloacid dehalogenase superfamily)